MQIPTYQIHNVLKVYCKKLYEQKVSDHQKASDEHSIPVNIHDFAHGKRQSIIDKIEADIVDRMTHCIIRPNDAEITDATKPKMNLEEDDAAFNDHFVFNMIDENNVKTTHRLSWRDSDFLSCGSKNRQAHRFQPWGILIERKKPMNMIKMINNAGKYGKYLDANEMSGIEGETRLAPPYNVSNTGIQKNTVVNLSNSSKDIQAARETLELIKSFDLDIIDRSEMIEKIKQLYHAGLYCINAEHLAEKMIGLHFHGIM